MCWLKKTNCHLIQVSVFVMHNIKKRTVPQVDTVDDSVMLIPPSGGENLFWDIFDSIIVDTNGLTWEISLV